MMRALLDAEAPFLVGGAYAFARYTGIERYTKDSNLPRPCRPRPRRGCSPRPAARSSVSRRTGSPRPSGATPSSTLIWSSGNGVAVVDELWFAHATTVSSSTCPSASAGRGEIWSKALIMERERYDGADVAHLVHEQAHRLDWQRLLERFGPNWRVLLAHLTLFGFIYPQRRASIPDWLMAELVRRLRIEQRQAPPRNAVCHGTLLSRNQFAADVEQEYRDGRLPPTGNMSQREIDLWEQRRREEQGDHPWPLD